MRSPKQLVPKICGGFNSFLFLYQTPRLVTIKNKAIGITYRILQLCLLAYLVGYVFIGNKGYQRTDTAHFSVVTKVKGVMQRNSRGESEIWDSNDFVVPPQESNAFFIATNMIYTYNQTQSLCPEDPNVGIDGVHCTENFDCVGGLPTPYGNGIRTGRCDLAVGTCEISGWCPTEFDAAPKKPVLSGFDTITVLVKNHISFAKFKVKRRNILDDYSQQYLKTCRNHPNRDPQCPVFGFRDMVNRAEENGFDSMSTKVQHDEFKRFCVPIVPLIRYGTRKFNVKLETTPHSQRLLLPRSAS